MHDFYRERWPKHLNTINTENQSNEFKTVFKSENAV